MAKATRTAKKKKKGRGPSKVVVFLNEPITFFFLPIRPEMEQSRCKFSKS